MGNVIDWSDITNGRYPELDKLPNGNSPQTQNIIIGLAEALVHSKLSSRYTVPFSSNNYTARDLCIDAVFIQTQMTRQPDKVKLLRAYFDERITALQMGQADMVTDSGSVAITAIGDTIWSSTQDYHPVFGLGPIEKAVVSSAQLLDEAATRGENTI